MATSLHGIFAPALTPVRADLSPDIPRWIAFCKHLLSTGCHGLAPFGTTSEANSFSVEERIDMLDQLVASGVAPAQLMPGVGMCALTDSVRLTAHAVGHGCGGVLLLPPFYYKGVSDEGLYRTVAEIIERVGDARLRIYLYHIPPIAVVGWSLDLIERLVKDYPACITGMKDSSGDWSNMQAVLTRFPGFRLFVGSEKFLLQALRLGGVGTITAFANTMPGRLRHFYENWQAPDAEAMQGEVDRWRTIVSAYPVIPALKQIIAAELNDPAWLAVRPPLMSLSPNQSEELMQQLGQSLSNA